MNNHHTTRLLCQTAAFAAIIYLFTALLHLPSHTGYTHVGDGFLFLAACFLPAPYAAAAGAVGAGLADLLGGYALWMPATVLIKSCTALYFSHTTSRILCPRNLLALLPAWVTCIAGYYGYEALLTGNWVAPMAGISGYLTQCALSSVVFVLLGGALNPLRKRILSAA